MKKLIILLVLIPSLKLFSQSIHPLEAASNHYKELQLLNAEPEETRGELDTIKYSPSKYSAVALLYTETGPEYLNVAQIDQLKRSVQFPANSSDQTRAELNFLLKWQKDRTAAQEERAAQVLAPIGYWPHVDIMKNHPRYEENLKHLFFEGREVLGSECTADNYPNTAKLLRGITKDMRIMEFTTKYYLLRPRPYDLEPGLKPLAIMSSPSFASGHTLWAYIHAFTWSELIPEKRKEFLELAYEIGESREIMGIHYPSDEEAARVLAHNMLSAMVSNSEFVADLTAAKQEWRNKK